MDKTSLLSLAGCILKCYRDASPLAFFGFVLSCTVLISWINTLFEFYFCFQYAFETTSNWLSSAWNCCSTQVKNAAAPTESTSKSCTCEHAKSEYSLMKEDLEIVMEKLGMFLDPNDGKLQENIGSIEISALFNETEPSVEEVKGAFEIFDTNGDGYIDANELQKFLCQIGFTEVSENECQRMILAFDDDGDGKINLGEFEKLMGEA